MFNQTSESLPDLFTNILEFCRRYHLIKHGDTVIIGLSGGPDSVFLIYFLKEIQKEYALTLIAAHLDHEWRSESAQDILFCKQFCQRMQLPFIHEKASQISINKPLSGSQEDLGRHLRRTFFQKIASEYPAQKIALGHQRDDHIETFFIRLLRGAGLEGLCSIRPAQGNYIHPLLCIAKEQILSYLDARKISYLHDYTNEHDLHLRNKIRKYVIPALHHADSRFETNCVRTIEHLQETEAYLKNVTGHLFAEIAVKQSDAWYLDLKKLSLHGKYMQKRLLITWLIEESLAFTLTETFLEEILRFLTNPAGGQHILHPSWSIIKKGKMAFIMKM